MLVTTSIIITSYNQLSTLRLLFRSLERQTHQNFEVLIADDGSSDGTADFCLQKSSFDLFFLTQPDEGYRKSKIINEALRHARGQYLIFLDGDVILERHFVQDHLDLKKPDHFVCGRRVELGPCLSQQVTESDVCLGKFDRLHWSILWSAFKKDTTRVKRGWRVSHPVLRKLLRFNHPLDLLGSNFSGWKSDVLAVNGFNESIESYWGEDGDLFIRLRNRGKISIGAKSMCVQYHLFHKRREPDLANIQSYQKLLRNTEYRWAVNGYRIKR